MESLLQKILHCPSFYEKIALLDMDATVKECLQTRQQLRAFVATLPVELEYILKQLLAIGQWEIIEKKGAWDPKSLQALLTKLLPVDAFYREMGGLLGYHLTLLRFLKRSSSPFEEKRAFHPPSFVDFTQENKQVQAAIEAGIRAFPQMAEMYPLGGAADRLHLVDEKTGKELPAARLCFSGHCLLEGLIRDLQAREYLYFKLFGVQLTTPVAIMTSEEKDNHRHVLQICAEHRWFGRPKDAFFFFTQPLVPTVDEQGNWCFLGPCQLLFKPGGHGAIWKLARDEGVFSWLKQLGREKALVRQINNPAAGLDYGLLAFTGWGTKEERYFGFASCPRLVDSAEGINVLIEKDGKEIYLSNIEYCDFAKYGIEDRPLENGYSCFSSNTNILFVDLEAICRAVEKCPYPGLLINLKNATARLEMTMQNIADVFVEKKREALKTERTFITYNHRHKTIATAKKAYLPGHSLRETPENCFYEFMGAARELLQKHCAFQLPPRRALEEYLEKGPECAFVYHPALGPLYSIIGQKVREGKLGMGAHLQLEIADLELSNLDLEGSLRVFAEQVMGHFHEGILRYSSQTGRCILRNVSVWNRGVDWAHSAPFWKAHFRRFETLEIILKGHSEFIAENVTFYGTHRFVVEDGKRLRVEQSKEQLLVTEEEIGENIPFWNYSWEENIRVERAARVSHRLGSIRLC